MGYCYQFTNSWFRDVAKNPWDVLVPHLSPSTILEIGSYEGASICYLIDLLAAKQPIEVHCVDTWEGGLEAQPNGIAPADMNAVEERFHRNTQLAVENAPHPVDFHVHKGRSDAMLAKLLAGGKASHFGFIYVDGSHEAPDVLSDAVLAFRLLKVGGLMVFDDYLWAPALPGGVDPLQCPKPAIDAFTNLYCRKVEVIPAPLAQLYVQKVSE